MEAGLSAGRRKPEAAFIFMLLAMALGYALIHDLLGGTLLEHSPWDSYTLQALAWRKGSMALEKNYSWLELAVYEGRYYVSFPPFPSVLLLPFTFIFGENTPNNLIVAAAAMGCAAAAYRLARRARFSPKDSAILGLFITFGSNIMWMSTNGGVWFMAQTVNMLLLLCAALSACTEKRGLSYALVALAVGCRPFSAVMFAPLFLYFFLKDRGKGLSLWKTALLQWKAFIPVALIAAAYMWYNYARFDSILEFGHNYLPEFTSSEKGQFHLSYIGQNLLNILRPVTLGEGLSLEYSIFDGFIFFIADPLFLLFFAAALRAIRGRACDTQRLCLASSMLAGLILLCAHKTFGGWQFGARYTVDLLPAALAYICLAPGEKGGGRALKLWEKAAAAFGIAFNIYGALAMNFLHG